MLEQNSGFVPAQASVLAEDVFEQLLVFVPMQA
jgi:hypothetical protein